MSILKPALLAAALVGVFSASSGAVAQSSDPITVKVNMARVLRINAPASTVIIGNPGVADVTIQDPRTLVLTGKSFGSTNLIVLDGAGNPIADTMISVIQAQGDLLTVYLGDQRTTMACSPVCQPTVMMGDAPGFSRSTLESSTVVATSAQ